MPSRVDAPPAHRATRCGQEDRKIIKITRGARAKVRLVPRTLNLRGNAAMFPLYIFQKRSPSRMWQKSQLPAGRRRVPDFLVRKLKKALTAKKK
jgi:hypothetical protein